MKKNYFKIMAAAMLLGMSFGLSPMSPEGWAPMGLKYLSSMTLHSGSETQMSRRMSSIKSLVEPYGLVVESGIVSTKGGTLFIP